MKTGKKNIDSNHIDNIGEVNVDGFDAPPNPPSGHVHSSIEISVVKQGTVTMLYGGTVIKLEANRLIVHWGMLPHQVLERTQETTVVGLHIPLILVLQWDLPAYLLTRLLALELFIEPSRAAPCSDLDLLLDWNRLLAVNDEISREIVLTETRSRLLRMLHTQSDTSSHFTHDKHISHLFFNTLRYIIKHFKEPITLSEISDVVGISKRHLARVFQENTGQTINSYIVHLRLLHAMRLLATTDRTVTDIMYDAGFSCTTHFYRVFREQTGKTPREYRQG